MEDPNNLSTAIMYLADKLEINAQEIISTLAAGYAKIAIVDLFLIAVWLIVSVIVCKVVYNMLKKAFKEPLDAMETYICLVIFFFVFLLLFVIFALISDTIGHVIAPENYAIYRILDAFSPSEW